MMCLHRIFTNSGYIVIGAVLLAGLAILGGGKPGELPAFFLYC